MKRVLPWLIYDGNCPFCERNSALLVRLLRGRLHRVPAAQSGYTQLHPSLTEEAAGARLHLLLPDGRLFSGAQAIARTLALAPWGRIGLVYYLPGVGCLLEWAYRYVAANRLRWWSQGDGCSGGACQINSHRPASKP
jgi:predicted DCC family thiol-disulfide oxidoreductase YuxK